MMLEEIIIQNAWWKTKHISESRLGAIGRQDFESLIQELASNKITCLLGPRRAGKTTLMYGMIDHLLNSGVNERNILFISFDNPKIRLALQNGFDEMLMEYSGMMVREPIDSLTDTVYIFLDEIHKLDDWGNIIKYWQDMGLKIKFIVSGSSSLRILKGSGESLLGRIYFHLILPLTFSEITGRQVDADIHNFDDIKKAHDNLILEKQDLLIKLDDYILKGGYPEVFDMDDTENAYDVLKLYKTLTINRDILDLKDIKEPRILSDLTDLLSDFMSQRMNYSAFAEILSIKVDTVKNYISYLEECFLVYTAYIYSKKQVISTRKEKKLFFIDCGLRNSLVLKEINELEKTKIVENLVFSHVLSLKKKELFPKIFYWQDKAKNEVDIVFTSNNRTIPIEVKYTNDIEKNDLKGLVKFCETFKTEGIVVTKDLLKKDDNITYIPVWLFLLMTQAVSKKPDVS
ncbi:MAG TPA: ATP-binding protein [Methanosarcinaceae archaeon]|nr:ATP-binding protein [Methanosarcinaceae archaeon]HJH30922.1 ATP-binding protein [Methanosarcinaceae archaeon]